MIKLINLLKKTILNKTWISLKFFQFRWELFVYSISILLSLFIGRFIETLILIVSFHFIRSAFPLTFHHDNFYKCIQWSIMMFAICIFELLLFPLSITLLGGIIIAYVDCFVLYYCQLMKVNKIIIENQRKEIKELLDKLNHKDIYAMNEQELYEHCRNCGLNDVECKIAYYVVIERLKGKELYDAINYSEAQAKRKRKKILNSIKN